jgi:hypothetical protein
MDDDPLLLALRIAGFVLVAACVLLMWGVWRNWAGSPVGPRREFGASLAEPPGPLSRPPNPSLNVSKPWFRLWGPAWLDLQQGIMPPRRFWLGHVHDHAAYRFYLRDNLPRAVWALSGAMRCGVQAGQWAAQLHYLASAELSVREVATRVEHGPFTFGSPAPDPVPDSLRRVVDAAADVVRRLLGFEPPRLTITVLDDEELPHGVGSRYAYLARKSTGDQIYLLPDPARNPNAAAEGFVWEYVRLALAELARGRAPAWLMEGVAQWVAGEVGAPVPPPEPVPEALLHPSAGERMLESVFGRSSIDRAVRRGLSAGAVVARLIDRFGADRLWRFVRALRKVGEEAAFDDAFGMRQWSFLGR